MFVPFGWLLIFVALNRNICSTSSVINLLSLNLWLFILWWVSLLFFLYFVYLMQDICPLIFKTLSSHYIIVSSLDSNDTSRFWLRGPTWYGKGILSFRRKCTSSVESTLMILILPLNDLFVAKIFHRIFMGPTELHFLYKVFLTGDSSKPLVLPGK
jgi:hypothetical protein